MAWLSGYTFRKKITATGTTDGDWVSPTGFVDPDTAWFSEEQAYDDDTGTANVTVPEVPINSWSSYIEYTHAALYCDKVRFWANYNAATIDEISLDVYYGSAWHNIYEGAFTDEAWVEKAIGSTQVVTAMRMKFYNENDSTAIDAAVFECDFNEVKTLTNYQLALDVNYGAGSDSNLSVFCNSLCDTDFDDIRFCKSDGDTQIDYWLEEYTGSDDATFWVEFHSILPTATNYFYMYFGKTGDSTTSNGINTFLFFDDFDDNSIDTTTRWNVKVESGEGITLDETGGELKISGTGTETVADAYIISKVDIGQSHALMWKAKLTGSGTGYRLHRTGLYEDDTNFMAWYPIRWTSPDWNALGFWAEQDGGVDDFGIIDDTDLDSAYHDYEIQFDRSNGNCELFLDSVSKGTKTVANFTVGSLYFRFWGTIRLADDTVDARIDNVLVRNWTATNPTLAWSTREAQYSFTASVLIGNLVSATRSHGIVRSALVLIGNLVSTTRSHGIVRTASVLIGNLVSATRAVAYVRKAAILIGNKVFATRSHGIVRAASILVGVLVSATKIHGVVRSALVLIGNKVSATRSHGVVRTATVLIGNLVSATRAVAYKRTASVMIGNKVVATISHGVVRAASVLIGNLVSATRTVAYKRSALILIGNKVSATRSHGIVRTALVLVGNKVSATISHGIVRSALVLIGNLVSATRAVAYIRTATVLIGNKVSASFNIAYSTISAVVTIGNKVSATGTFGFIRSASVIIGNKVSATRAVSYVRSATVAIGVKVTATFAVFAQTVIEVTVYLYNRATTVYLNSRSLSTYLYNRALSLYARIK